jgi:mRNA interferase YafQ
MRTIRRTSQFKKDFKREMKGQHRKTLESALIEVVALLADDAALDAKFVDHPLTGQWADHRDCHVKPDLVLIYRKPDPDSLDLVRIGSHSELGI